MPLSFPSLPSEFHLPHSLPSLPPPPLQMEGKSAESDPARLLQLSRDLLRHRDFSPCRHYVLQALLARPSLRWPHQIFAILDVLTAAEHPLEPNLPDWYSILRMSRLSDDTELIKKQFNELSLLLNPLTNRFPLAQEAFTLVCDAWSLLSRSDEKALYDLRLAQSSSPKEGDADTFWTLCPYCYCLFEYYRVYEDCCLLCQRCKRAFQAVVIPSPPKAVDATNYYCCFSVFPLGFSGNVDELGTQEQRNAMGVDSHEKPEEEKGGDRTGKNIIILDHDEDFEVPGITRVVNVGRTRQKEEEVNQGSESIDEKMKTSEDGLLSPSVAERPMRKKYVAKNTKKLMGSGKRGRRYQEIVTTKTGKPACNLKAGSGLEETGGRMVGGLGSGSSGAWVCPEQELYEEDDDIPVGVPISPYSRTANFESF